MTSKRVVLAAFAVIALIFVCSIAQSLLFDVGSVTPATESLGPVKLTSMALDLPGSAVSLPSEWTGSLSAVSYNWKDAQTQELLGPIRVAVLWSRRPQRRWLRAGSVCSFIFQYFENGDGLVHVPGFDALTMKDMHICMCTSPADRRSWFYAYSIADPRCRTSAVVFWKIPWTLASDAPHADEINRQLDGGLKARAFNAVRASIEPDVACQDTVRSFAHAAVITLLVSAGSVLVLLVLLYRRSAT